LRKQQARDFRVALVGNPNSGKTSLFNLLTGLRHKTGNFPGVTVERKSGVIEVSNGTPVELIDLPGAYSLYPTSDDERVVVNILSNPSDPAFPDAIIYIADLTNLEKHLLLLSQIQDLQIPCILALNMLDLAEQSGLKTDYASLSKKLALPVVPISGRSGQNIDQLKQEVFNLIQHKNPKSGTSLFSLNSIEKNTSKAITNLFQTNPSLFPFKHLRGDYHTLLLAHHADKLPYLNDEARDQIQQITAEKEFQSLHFQVEETMERYDRFLPIVRSAVKMPQVETTDSWTDRIDRVVTHQVFGPLIFFLLMLIVFQAIYTWATIPMDAIEGLFGWLGELVKTYLPAGYLADLLSDGILAGLGGIFVFIPQIAILFFLIGLLEEVGYMARAVYLFDQLMQRFGLNGRSIVALISGNACAIPAVMSTRTITNWKERLITILVTPFISCSARIPVYTVLIGFVVPSVTVWGIFDAQGLAFMGLYLLGILTALIAAWVFKLILRGSGNSYLMIQLPPYRAPVMRNVLLNMWDKVKTFILEAGRIIFFISIILWVLATFGPASKMAQAEEEAIAQAQTQQLDETATEDLVASYKLEASYAGHLGHFIEPVIAPLGYDWKIGVALLTSFAAREVFVGTMATLYSIGSTEDEGTIRDRMAKEVDPRTGQPIYTMATSLSLLLFYVFAMQCVSTLAVVRRETNSIKWPLIQFTFMTILAYVSALVAYQTLS